MNALYNIFSGISIFDCIAFQNDESEHGALRSASERPPAGKDNYVLSTGHGEPVEDRLTDEDSELDLWAWPEGYILPTDVSENSKRMGMIQKIQEQINEKSKTLKINYHSRAQRTGFELNNCTILRYLQAALWEDPPANQWGPAAERILETIDWRVSVPLPVSDRSAMKRELATGKFNVRGVSKDGRPILYIRIGRENTWDPRGNLLALVYSLERAVAVMEAGTCEMVAVVDCAGVGMMNAPSTAFIKLAIEVMGKHYPRRNGQVFIVNVSSVFYMVWNLISMTLNEATKKKIQILTSDTAEMREKIGELVDPAVLLSDYGGDVKDEFAVDSYLDLDANLS